MRPNRYILNTVLSFLFCLALVQSYGQLGISFDLKKPKEYDDRVLRSEKSDEKKFNLPRRFIQNTVTRYNYFFNANNKLNEVIAKAKEQHKDDFSKLLSFYNYSLDVTAKDSIQLDSVVYKSETGIALHDLRNDWADNLYLLWGAAYYLQKEFDSAYLMFQFINYAFAGKEKDGYYKTIGSSMDGNQAFSISTKEKTSLPKKIFAEPPSRNDAFIWQIRNFLMQDQFAEAASLIVVLKNDPLFPKRLNAELNEVQALWFYKQNMWDSAAPHLISALDVAVNKNEKARWEYLAAQMYEMIGKPDQAEKLYSAVISHTTDPIMEVYARLNSIRANKSGGENYIDKNIAELLKMARKDKYDEYRDIIYYMAAQMELDRGNLSAAEALLQKSTKYFSGDQQQRNKAFLQLAEIAYSRKFYHASYNYYDSLNLNDPSLPDTAKINRRKEVLGKIVYNLDIKERQDSLQKIAALPEDERKEFVKKLIKDLRKQQGLKEEANYTAVSAFGQQTNQNLFAPANPKGDWYFYNTDARAKGYNDFIATWGNRANNDNWRRSSAASGIRTQIAQPTVDKTNSPTGNNNNTGEISFDNLYNNLPLTPEKLKISDDSISVAMFNLGKLYAQDIEDCAASTETLESLRNRFPAFGKMDEVLFTLYYCYNKNGETAKTEQIKKLMNDKYPKSNFTTIVTTGKDPLSKTNNPEATKEYEDIYDLFIEGNFAQAVAKKKIADSIYGKNYWTPQLLYIEAVYYIKQRQDSVAKKVLGSIVSQFPKTRIAEKATTMIDVLNRRTQIESDLEKWVIKEPTQEQPVTRPVSRDTTSVQQKQITTSDKTDTAKNIVAVNKPPVDPNSLKPILPPPTVTPYSYTPDAAHYVMIVLTKVDPIFSGEAKNAFFRYNREAYYNKQMTADIEDLDTENRLLIIGSFKNADEALDYISKAKPLAPTEIIPWLKGGKYIFTIITEKNLQLLKAGGNLENYNKFLSEKFPGKF